MTRRTGAPWLIAILAWSAASCGGDEWVHHHAHSASRSETGAWQEGTGQSERAEPTARPTHEGEAPAGETFRNTYYDFPKEGGGAKSATAPTRTATPATCTHADRWLSLATTRTPR